MVPAAVVLATIAALSARIVEGRIGHSRPDVNDNSAALELAATGWRDAWEGYQYMPEQRVLVCACAKCGSTSFYELLYNQTFGKEWNYTDEPWVQNVASSRWHGKFDIVGDGQARELIANPEVFSFALARDPIERMISSWKSKAACDSEGWITDESDRDRIVPELMKMAGLQHATCLDLKQFVHAVVLVHRLGKAPMLDVHFRPQQYGCFREFGPAMWSQVAFVSEAGAARQLAMKLGHDDVTDFPHAHASTSQPVKKTDEINDLLKEITAEEYEALAEALAT